MTRAIAVVIGMMFLFGQSFAQSVGLKIGTVYFMHQRDFETPKIEGVFAYPLSQKFEASIITGYHRVHNDQSVISYPASISVAIGQQGTLIPTHSITYPAYTEHVIPIILGMKYTILRATVSPYLTMEYGRYFDVGNKDARLAHYQFNQRTADDAAHGAIFNTGGGINYQLTSRLILDVSAKLFESSYSWDGIELMAGVMLPL